MTKHFGEVEYEAEAAIGFPEGLPGFAEEKEFVLLNPDEDGQFVWLQSAANGDLAFALMNVYSILPDYNPLVDREQMESLGPVEGNVLEVYNVAVIPRNIREMRVNLRAPIVINRATHTGKQVILNNDEYSVRYMVFPNEH